MKKKKRRLRKGFTTVLAILVGTLIMFIGSIDYFEPSWQNCLIILGMILALAGCLTILVKYGRQEEVFDKK